MSARSTALLIALFLFGAACTSPEGQAEESSSNLTCVPKQELVCLCGLSQGVQTCSAKGVPGKCRCPDDDAKEENDKRGQKSAPDNEPETEDEPLPKPQPEQSSPPATPVNPTQACEDVADAVFDAADRCDLDPFAERTAFVDAAAGGSCANITAVRDVKSLYDACIPWFESATCTDLTTGPVDPSCASQLLR